MLRTMLLAATCLTFAAPVALPQTTGTSQSPNEGPSRSLTFDVVSIRPNNSEGQGGMGRTTPTGDTNVNSLLVYQIAPAYGVEPDDVYGLPDWAKNTHYDIQYKVAAEDIEAYGRLSRAEHQRMVQAMFEDRLKLKAHLGSKEIPMYALVVAKSGPKLHEARPGDTYTDGVKTPDGRAIGAGGSFMGPGFFTGQQVTISQLMRTLKSATGRVVLDKTGLTGKYDVTLHWTPDQLRASEDATTPDASPISIFSAVEEQLGLKLEATRGTIRTLVIEHIEPPTEN